MTGSGSEQGLEVVVRGIALVVPANRLERIGTLDVSPLPPIANRFVVGLGVADEGIFVVVDIAERPAHHSRDDAHYALFRVAKAGHTSLWALRLDNTRSLVHIVRTPQAVSARGDLPPWIVAGQTTDAIPQAVHVVDVDAMTRQLSIREPMPS